ncbi:transcriptional regulator [Bifidobacterium animalis subsp. animalis]|uniref:helix-turn-helix transcriptional regulator n=1 Tax=Bifidobacterium animalis TaxID=28025 RepID=UPI001020678F|nr:helix-turn-helix transcriptional regulator [Bifidobacterium animalis]RYN15333.1 transcriptional regulator [Bifidobacterium animalis subsp. animalis]
MRSFNSMLDEQMDDPEFATVFEAEIERLNAAVAVSRAREDARLTQEQLAERSGVSRVTINRIERGKLNPSMKTLSRLARAMGKQVRVSIS